MLFQKQKQTMLFFCVMFLLVFSNTLIAKETLTLSIESAEFYWKTEYHFVERKEGYDASMIMKGISKNGERYNILFLDQLEEYKDYFYFGKMDTLTYEICVNLRNNSENSITIAKLSEWNVSKDFIRRDASIELDYDLMPDVTIMGLKFRSQNSAPEMSTTDIYAFEDGYVDSINDVELITLQKKEVYTKEIKRAYFPDGYGLSDCPHGEYEIQFVFQSWSPEENVWKGRLYSNWYPITIPKCPEMIAEETATDEAGEGKQ